MEKFARFLHGHLEDVGNTLALVFYLQRLAVVPLSAANLAGHENIGQEVHFDFDDAVAEAVLAAPA